MARTKRGPKQVKPKQQNTWPEMDNVYAALINPKNLDDKVLNHVIARGQAHVRPLRVEKEKLDSLIQTGIFEINNKEYFRKQKAENQLRERYWQNRDKREAAQARAEARAQASAAPKAQVRARGYELSDIVEEEDEEAATGNGEEATEKQAEVTEDEAVGNAAIGEKTINIQSLEGKAVKNRPAYEKATKGTASQDEPIAASFFTQKPIEDDNSPQEAVAATDEDVPDELPRKGKGKAVIREKPTRLPPAEGFKNDDEQVPALPVQERPINKTKARRLPSSIQLPKEVALPDGKMGTIGKTAWQSGAVE